VVLVTPGIIAGVAGMDYGRGDSMYPTRASSFLSPGIRKEMDYAEKTAFLSPGIKHTTEDYYFRDNLDDENGDNQHDNHNQHDNQHDNQHHNGNANETPGNANDTLGGESDNAPGGHNHSGTVTPGGANTDRGGIEYSPFDDYPAFVSMFAYGGQSRAGLRSVSHDSDSPIHAESTIGNNEIGNNDQTPSRVAAAHQTPVNNIYQAPAINPQTPVDSDSLSNQSSSEKTLPRQSPPKNPPANRSRKSSSRAPLSRTKIVNSQARVPSKSNGKIDRKLDSKYPQLNKSNLNTGTNLNAEVEALLQGLGNTNVDDKLEILNERIELPKGINARINVKPYTTPLTNANETKGTVNLGTTEDSEGVKVKRVQGIISRTSTNNGIISKAIAGQLTSSADKQQSVLSDLTPLALTVDQPKGIRTVYRKIPHPEENYKWIRGEWKLFLEDWFLK
jgi:hypothetical protein